MKFNNLAIITLAAALSSCSSVNSYQEPLTGSQAIATVSGSSTRSGLHVWSTNSVTSVDDKAVGMQMWSTSKTNVTPGTHRFLITTEFNSGWGTGPYNSLTEVVVNIKPGMSYRVVSKPVGAKLTVWAEDSRGQRVSNIGVSNYQIEAVNYTPVFIAH